MSFSRSSALRTSDHSVPGGPPHQVVLCMQVPHEPCPQLWRFRERPCEERGCTRRAVEAAAGGPVRAEQRRAPVESRSSESQVDCQQHSTFSVSKSHLAWRSNLGMCMEQAPWWVLQKSRGRWSKGMRLQRRASFLPSKPE
uniref:Uncharacterized protein n=1 Tax=Rousettus aegyptiacus TaxID=9407 RepID=A0A7J8E8U0_ROUAE|nr:hypothetical protein HJG63_008237 [Rousettus aegyptiacus]